MDDKSQSARPSGIPRFSRLPVPNKTPSIRPAPSRESLLAKPAEVRLPKLRAAPSRDNISSTTTTLRKKEPTGSLSSNAPQTKLLHPNPRSRAVSAQTSKTPRSFDALPNGRSVQTPPRQAVDGLYRKSPSLTRRPSEQFRQTPDSAAEISESSDDNARDVVPVEVESTSGYDTIRAKPFKPRPSLSERTIETLSQIPSSPAVKGRPSAFFDPEGTTRRPSSRPGSRGSRPGSSYQSDSSNRAISRPQSRPGSSSGQDDNGSSFRASKNTFKVPLTPINGTPLRGRASETRTFTTPSSRTTTGGTIRGPSTKSQTPQAVPFNRSRTPSPEKRTYDLSATGAKYGSKSLSARPMKTRPSLNGLFKKPSMPNVAQKASSTNTRKSSLASRSSTSNEETIPSSASTTSTALTVDSGETTSSATSRKSSAALREQIAKAKAAKRATSRQVSAQTPSSIEEAPVVPTDTSFDFGLPSDPFGQRRDEQAQSKVVQSRVHAARTSGRLNIAAMGLRTIPSEVINIYDMESTGNYDGSWAESVDLTRFVAADNEIEMIEDTIFPDQDPQDMADDEDGKGNIFGGLETLDLHGNMLICLPMGLRRLHLLTSLNLSQNRITNNALEVISQMTALRDLKLGGNLFYGPLDPSFSKLENLEIADLHGNNISALPLNLENMSKLRILNISENNFEQLLFEPLSKLPLTELLARKNKLSGTLIEDAVESLPSLQVLDVSSNQVTHVVSSGRKVDLPALHQLTVSMNRLQELPNISQWVSLITLSADENNINSVPEGFTILEKLRHADFSSNDIRAIPPEVGRMENLAMLRLSGNPLRDKKFCTATTDELKATLAARLEPTVVQPTPEIEPAGSRWPDGAQFGDSTTPSRDAAAAPRDDNSDSRSDDDFATPPTSAPQSPARSRSHTTSTQTWPVRSGGVLDRSETQSSSLHPVISSRIAAEVTIREIYLQRNLFTALPDSLSFFADSLTVLNMAHNQLVGESYLGGTNNSEVLELRSLKELNLSSNHVTGLSSLINDLRAPALQKLDVSFNRIASLPPGPQLRAAFPSLAVLLLSNNHLSDLDPETIKGLRIVDVMNNDIDHLNPRIGLLGGAGGLERLELTGNRFRVPRFNVIERGTEATLRWLRGRVPVAEMGAWKASQGGGSDSLDDVD